MTQSIVRVSRLRLMSTVHILFSLGIHGTGFNSAVLLLSVAIDALLIVEYAMALVHTAA